ncbi:MAG: UDP-3-O-acyl-N-acetylglucosamine deacetylase [Puniceicoccales bacterium]|jgi:UDP-3-O-[3-hydroxymyristoyl] N-acetylglucosamine deacetylase/3-hydroxyacyl-[acyl-carrier-protein] dehydratase|nr:UDP-3-O-acyl-N-acetylglucosamine deacetylase [Puniceicoccales bacterium]
MKAFRQVRVKQRGILREVIARGRALHCGRIVTLKLRPSPADSGIVFCRTDLPGCPELRPDIEKVSDLVRATTIANGDVQINTVEHLLAALNGLSVDNVFVEVDGPELPILDGSAENFTRLLREAGIAEQARERVHFTLRQPVYVHDGNRTIFATPHDGLRITCTYVDDRGVHTQHLTLEITPETFASEIAHARTFVRYEDITPLLEMGKIQGGDLDSAIVLDGDRIISREPLHFPNEFVRHKILDLLGDIALLGRPLKAHIVAIRPGHALNAKFTREVRKHFTSAEADDLPKGKLFSSAEGTGLDVHQIINLIPHRYPFLLIDRVLTINETGLVAIKNVSINEPYFQGHFPGRPVMPGVLQIEAMAQAAGVFMLHRANLAGKLALFMSCDRVKFRRMVEPGDQLCIEIQLRRHRGERIGIANGVCYVDGKVTSSAELMFTIADDNSRLRS